MRSTSLVRNSSALPRRSDTIRTPARSPSRSSGAAMESLRLKRSTAHSLAAAVPASTSVAAGMPLASRRAASSSSAFVAAIGSDEPLREAHDTAPSWASRTMRASSACTASRACSSTSISALSRSASWCSAIVARYRKAVLSTVSCWLEMPRYASTRMTNGTAARGTRNRLICPRNTASTGDRSVGHGGLHADREGPQELGHRAAAAADADHRPDQHGADERRCQHRAERRQRRACRHLVRGPDGEERGDRHARRQADLSGVEEGLDGDGSGSPTAIVTNVASTWAMTTSDGVATSNAAASATSLIANE